MVAGLFFLSFLFKKMHFEKSSNNISLFLRSQKRRFSRFHFVSIRDFIRVKYHRNSRIFREKRKPYPVKWWYWTLPKSTVLLQKYSINKVGRVRFQWERWGKLLLSRFSLWWRVVARAEVEDGQMLLEKMEETKTCDLQLRTAKLLLSDRPKSKIMNTPQFSNLDFIRLRLPPLPLIIAH